MKKTRVIVQILFLAFVVYLSIGHYMAERGIELPGTANLHAVCPFGGIVAAYTFVTSGSAVQKLHDSNYYMLIALFISLFLTGAFFCGWLCPMGTIQEWLGKLGKRVFPKWYNRVPKKLDRLLRLGKYAVLAFVLFQTARTGMLMFGNLDPYYNLLHIWTDEVALSGYLSVALTLIFSLLIERPFCRYACPLGAVNGFFNLFSFLTIKRNPQSCINCKRCDQVCPAGIVVSEKQTVRDLECIRCMQCVEACPVNQSEPSTLKVRGLWARAPNRNAKGVPIKAYLSLALLAFLLPILLSLMAGVFATEKVRVYETIDDIKGSTTLMEIITHYEMPKETLYHAFGIPEIISADTKIKEVISLMGLNEADEILSPERIRSFLEIRDRAVSELKEITHADVSSLEDLIKNAGLKPGSTIEEFARMSPAGAFAYVLSGSWPQEADTGSIQEAATPSTGHESVSAVDVKGSTTWGEVKAMIKDINDLYQSFPMLQSEPDSATIKTLKETYGIEVSEIKSYVQNHLK